MMGLITPVQCQSLAFYLEPEWVGKVSDRLWTLRFVDSEFMLTVEAKHQKDNAPERAKKVAKELKLELQDKGWQPLVVFPGCEEASKGFTFQAVTTMLLPDPDGYGIKLDKLNDDGNYNYAHCFEVSFKTEYVWLYFRRSPDFLSNNLARYVLNRVVFKSNDHKQEVRKLLTPQFGSMRMMTLEQAKEKFTDYVNVVRKFRRKRCRFV